MHITLSQPFSRSGTVDEFDVVQIKKALNRLGYYLPHKETGITEFADSEIFKALARFQRDYDLPATGAAKPGDETLITLNRALKLPRPGKYLWRTVEDENVRPAHARFNRTIRSWDDDPDPGDDFNCRCWAEPIDAINPTVGPFDLLSGGMILRRVAGRAVLGTASRLRLTQKMREANSRDVDWIKSIPRSQLQSKFKHAIDLGVKGNVNNQNLAAFRKALETHVKSPDTIIKHGTYHKEPVIHYLNKKSGINLMRTKDGNFKSVWRLSDKQITHVEESGKLGGSYR